MLPAKTDTLSRFRASPIVDDLREGFLRFLAVAAMFIFAYRGVYNLVIDPARLNVLLLTISETLTLIWLLLARRPKVRDWNPLTVVITLTATLGPGLISLQPGVEIISLAVAAPLQCLALWMSIWGKLSLGRSFALLPANRGVVTGGAYRFVRHPIYAGYITGHILFLLSNFSLYNFGVYAIISSFQIYRLTREEAILAMEPEYRDYLGKVRYRFFPGIF
ncbi:isoprenylcysteine carboxylmethyltransferase family protein [Mesorhizobium sp. CU2]|uniref:methyltransferase family protein n=1 Tax=unclassified Mesorhizobium TaxID=325217 RepID=UPI00112E8472|nr:MULTISPECIES: isoprenylcysteine carboxylmethyltransferase family protein [unclassified Mesorhizobium]TPN80948.1 isoprenylcysteine carboxylmethyltransferase family protein [Mesorhizobium sp. CU3]TPO03912.1 isoprenylcysteine carboxylmethyltransferase family protein [Mesorhizobium sp. CU2]